MRLQEPTVRALLMEVDNPEAWMIFPKLEMEIRKFAQEITDINLDIYMKEIRNLFVQGSPSLLLGAFLKNGEIDGFVSGVYGPSLSGHVLFIHIAKMVNYFDMFVDLLKRWVERAKKSGIMFSGRIQFVTERSDTAWTKLIEKFGGSVRVRSLITVDTGGVL